MTENRMTEEDKRAEEQALFMTWLTALPKDEWEIFRDHIGYFQDTLPVLPLAVALVESTLTEYKEKGAQPEWQFIPYGPYGRTLH